MVVPKPIYEQAGIAFAAIMVALAFFGCTAGTEPGLAGKVQGTWVDANGAMMEFAGTRLHEHADLGGTQAMDLTSTVVYHDPDRFTKAGLGGAELSWRVTFPDPDHMDLTPPLYPVQPIDHFARK